MNLIFKDISNFKAKLQINNINYNTSKSLMIQNKNRILI